MPPRALPPVLTPARAGVLAVVLVPPLAVAALDAAEPPGRWCTTTVVDRHLGTGPTCLDPDLDLDLEGVRRLVAVWRGQ